MWVRGDVGYGDMGHGDVGTQGLGAWGLGDSGTRRHGTRGRDKQTTPDVCVELVKYNFQRCQER